MDATSGRLGRVFIIESVNCILLPDVKISPVHLRSPSVSEALLAVHRLEETRDAAAVKMEVGDIRVQMVFIRRRHLLHLRIRLRHLRIRAVDTDTVHSTRHVDIMLERVRNSLSLLPVSVDLDIQSATEMQLIAGRSKISRSRLVWASLG